jgi:hypothetical protein
VISLCPSRLGKTNRCTLSSRSNLSPNWNSISKGFTTNPWSSGWVILLRTRPSSKSHLLHNAQTYKNWRNDTNYMQSSASTYLKKSFMNFTRSHGLPEWRELRNDSMRLCSRVTGRKKWCLIAVSRCSSTKQQDLAGLRWRWILLAQATHASFRLRSDSKTNKSLLWVFIMHHRSLTSSQPKSLKLMSVLTICERLCSYFSATNSIRSRLLPILS